MARVYDKLSFTKAKATVFAKLIAAVGTIDSIKGWKAKNGQNSFQGFLPPTFDTWGITFGGGGDVSQTWNTKPPWEMQMNWDIEGQFRDQAAADEVGMGLLSGMDMGRLDANGNTAAAGAWCLVQTFRLRAGGNLDVYLGSKKIANEGAKEKDGTTAPVPLWILKMGGIIVFNTWREG